MAEREFSAGGVVLRGDEVVVISPRRRAPDGRRVLGLPKGHPEEGETPEAAAAREVREETGVTAELVEKLGEVSYFYRRGGRPIEKLVAFFLFDYVEGDTADHDHEVDDARWVPLADAVRDLTFPGEREMAARALSRVGSDR
jgi:8-oxo-dGTP pyrophosphatase MutT (NUDIX family)